MSKINIIRKVENLENKTNEMIEDSSAFKVKIDEEQLSFTTEIRQELQDQSNKMLEDITRIENVANYKDFRFTKPVNKIYGLTTGMTQLSIDFDFHPDVMEVRLEGKPLIHYCHSHTYYDYKYKDGIIIFRTPIESNSVLWIRSEVTLDIKMHIEKEYIYEDYITKYGNSQKRLFKEIWTGDIIKTINYHYDDDLYPFRITKEKVLRDGKEYVREYEYTENGVKTKSTEGLEDYFVQRILGGEDLTRTEIKVVNMTEAEIKHDLGYMYPFVQVWSDNQLCMCVVEAIDENHIKVKTYDEPITGYIIVRK